MKRYQCLFFYIVALSTSCFANGPQDSFGDRLVTEAANRLDQYGQELLWYSADMREEEINMKKRLGSKKLYDNYLKDNQQLEELISKTQMLFLDFRTCVREIVFARHGATPDANRLLAAPFADMTHWYVNFMEELLFPDDWKEQFQAYTQLEQQNLNNTCEKQ